MRFAMLLRSRLSGNLTLRKRFLIVFLLLGVTPSVIIGFTGYRSGSQALMNNATRTIAGALDQSVSNTDFMFDELQNRVTALALDNDLNRLLAGPDPILGSEKLNQNRLLAHIMQRYLGQSFPLYSAQIVTDSYTYSLNTLLPYEPTRRPSIVSAAKRSGGELVWIPTYDYLDMQGLSELRSAKVDYRYLFSAVRPLGTVSIPLPEGGYIQYPQDKQLPVLVIYFQADIFETMLQKALDYKGLEYLVLTNDGTVIKASEALQSNKVLQKQFLSMSDESGVFTVNGRKTLVSKANMLSTQWKIVTLVPAKEIVSGVSLIQKVSFWFGLLLLIISAGIAVLISSWITAPLNRLLQGVRRTGHGDFNTLVKVGGSHEFVVLMNGFNEMNDRIQRLIQENYLRAINEKDAEIMALHVQLNPHFLYNTLGTINWMAIDNEQSEISTMIVRLCDMMRYTAKGFERFVTFKEDLQWLDNYLYIMSNRFVGKFETRLQIAPELHHVLVPKLFMQPFVENAILHGFENIEQGGILSISCRLVNGMVQCEIRDNGEGMPADKVRSLLGGAAGAGGIQNTFRRIKLLYEDNCSVDIKSQEGAGTVIVMEFQANV
ncbi:cache domain-containing sensor histidine kinase [Paenibacillus albus]|uniref:HAMP domain-containing protein n=1 Tax=Paenibacillus albus TaxID=2495582 RepID=A0A3Q8XAJ8_9BACL|nr:histidine kinase [Paenibacillus albus]AZN43121.1 HAMP domain-containing protein [Paenibacillus albus]